MSIQHWSEDVILVDLPEELETHSELQAVITMLHNGSPCDVVVDFSHVCAVHGAWLTQLYRIQRLAKERGHKLTLCGLAPATRAIFSIAHIDTVFEFAEDRFTALAEPHLVG